MDWQGLSGAERGELLTRHKVEHDGRVRDRMKVVLWRDEGISLEEIAHRLFLTEEGVRIQLKDYIAEQKLKPENGGSEERLDAAQAAALEAHLEEHLYQKVEDICAYVKERYGIEYTVSGMTDWLARHDFTYHKTSPVPAKANAEAQQKHIDHYRQVMKEVALSKEDEVWFIDGAHPTHAVKCTNGWIKKGTRKEIPTNAGQKRVNLMGALNLEKMEVRVKDYLTINAQNITYFLDHLQATSAHSGTLHIFLDRAGYHTCPEMQAYAARNPRIQLHLLPPYSPNLNAIEPLWKIMHEHLENNNYYASFAQFTEAIWHFFHTTFPAKASEWTDRLTDNFRVIGSPLTPNLQAA